MTRFLVLSAAVLVASSSTGPAEGFQLPSLSALKKLEPALNAASVSVLDDFSQNIQDALNFFRFPQAPQGQASQEQSKKKTTTTTTTTTAAAASAAAAFEETDVVLKPSPPKGVPPYYLLQELTWYDRAFNQLDYGGEMSKEQQRRFAFKF